MNIFTYGGPSFNDDNLPPFTFEVVPEDHKGYINGIPLKWNFTPFFFGEENFK